MMDKAIAAIGARFPLTRRDAGEYAQFKAGPLSIRLDWYEAAGLGNVSVLHGRAMGGLMKMDTLVVNAIERDVPLFSYDYIAAMGNHTMLVEYYDTMIDDGALDFAGLFAAKDGIAALPDHDLGAHWYDSIKLAPSFAKKTKKRALPQLNAAFEQTLDAYLALAEALPPLTGEACEAKRAKAAAYVDGLLTNGGPSTDAFVKALGAEKTAAIFRRIVFGTEA